jgi:hypothetical protein
MQDPQMWTAQFMTGSRECSHTKRADLLSEVQYRQCKYELAKMNLRRYIEAGVWGHDSIVFEKGMYLSLSNK